MKLIMYGGSFDPIHIGHQCLANTVAKMFDARVVVVPAFANVFKEATNNAAIRLEMVRAAFAGNRLISVNDYEIRKEGPSYTIDTIKHLMSVNWCSEKMGLLIGDDIAGELPRWKNFEKILERCNVIIAVRNGMPSPIDYPAIVIDNDVVSISSSMIRGRIKSNGPWEYLVPSEVRAIIKEKGLYL